MNHTLASKKRICLLLSVLLAMLSSFTGCSLGSSSVGKPVTLTFWHVYGEQTDSPMNDMIDQFNQTVGREKGIFVNVTSVTDNTNMEDALQQALAHAPGAPELPDLFVTYPKTLLSLDQSELFLDFSEYMSEDELRVYIPTFLEEGVIDDHLLIFPLAKSTELLFLNQTLFDRFSQATGRSMSDLSDIDDFWLTCRAYYDWTDSQTPDVPYDGKTMFMQNELLHFFSLGLASLGKNAFRNEGLDLTRPEWKELWIPYAKAAISGGVSLLPGYASDPMKTGEIIAAGSSTAGILYYKDSITYPDNTSEKIEISVLPSPSMANAVPLLYQRGAGICAFKSSPSKNEAAVEFVRWLTNPTQNLYFTTRCGYLPVTESAYDQLLEKGLDSLGNEKYRQLYQVVSHMHKVSTFYAPPQFKGYSALEDEFQDYTRQILTSYRNTYYADSPSPAEREAYLDRAAEASFEDLKTHFQ